MNSGAPAFSPLPGQVAGQSFGGELDGRQRVPDLVGDALRHFLPSGCLLRAQQFGEVVDHDDVTCVRPVRAERAHGYRSVNQTAAQTDFELFPGRSHSQGASNQMLNIVRDLVADQVGQVVGFARALAKNLARRGVDAQELTLGIEGENPGGNVLQHRLDQDAAAIQLLNGLLEMLRELVNLLAAIRQLRGHGVEGAYQRSQLVLSLDLHAGIEAAGGDLVGGFGQRLDRDGDFLGKEESEPSGGKKKQDGDQR